MTQFELKQAAERMDGCEASSSRRYSNRRCEPHCARVIALVSATPENPKSLTSQAARLAV